jgi:tRNA modification GTPase
MAEETIVAVATPPGRGGVGVVRLSGNRAFEITSSLVQWPKLPPETQRATLGDFLDPDSGKVLDRVIVTWFHCPHSYTGEDVAEISCHGAPVVLTHFVECCLSQGARLAEPGEFTMRGFLNGRVDLTQAEAIRDLIESRTLYQARMAAQQMEGSVSTRLRPHKAALVNLIAGLEAGIDFAEDDVPVSGWEEVKSHIQAARCGLEEIAQGFEFGRVVREGLSLAIVGRPNVGKSSLFNRLLKEERAIVTAIPGTTRDLVSETASLGGIPVRLVDTAGIRTPADPVEKIGVEKSLQALADADLRLLVLDAGAGWVEEDENLWQKIRPLGATLVACNKCDLPSRLAPADLCRLLRPANQESRTRLSQGSSDHELPRSTLTVALESSVPVVWTSALTGEGVSQLQEMILSLAAPARELCPEGEVITNLRHQEHIRDALRSLEKAREAATLHVPHEMVLLDLYEALHALDTITGATTTEDLLSVIFSTFCVGK